MKNNNNKINNFLVWFVVLCFFGPLSQAENTQFATVEIRKIIPPKLDEKHLGKRILSYRPMRHGTPQMKIEVINGKVVAHNYGHGGSGWTLGPGSANYVNKLLEESNSAADLTKDTPITIIGAGIIGLFSAYNLVNKGYTNITIVAAQFDSLTSHNAGGLVAPVSMHNDVEMQKIINQIGIEAYKFYKEIAEGKNKFLPEGAIIVPTYFETREKSGLEPYVNVVMQPAKDVLLDFGNGKTQKMVAYDDGIFVDTAIMMASLTKYLTSKIKFVKRKIKTFGEVETKYIINCTGLGAQALTGDKKLVSVQGHLIMLKNQKPQNLQHMILVYFGEKKNKNGQKITRSFYMFPKKLHGQPANDIGVIGGTFIEGATRDTPNEEEFDIMMKNARDFYGIKSQ